MSESYRRRITRREALAWMGTMSATAVMAGCGVYPDPEGALLPVAKWPELGLKSLSGPGYGTDPVLTSPEAAPWSLTLSRSELDLIARLAESICPGAVNAGVADVLNEWLSAPYDNQQADRALVLPGLTWVKQHCQTRYGVNFGELRESQQVQLLESLDLPEGQESPDMLMPTRFFDRLRTLVAGAYFSSPQGIAELGYQGNVAIQGDYPGPSDEAMAHLQALLDELGLDL
jgi:hypothetical protein